MSRGCITGTFFLIIHRVPHYVIEEDQSETLRTRTVDKLNFFFEETPSHLLKKHSHLTNKKMPSAVEEDEISRYLFPQGEQRTTETYSPISMWSTTLSV